ncbi:Nucleosome assembly protein 1-like 1 [Saguinus oedipus]|uniref:Nucleosome assembly protein 1-like 1 n=1 Tax=Saguinus oedipus TaxID=9490 RepID=A0ABQ9WA70_SAGOE|nr:Nucleosome assembly protein 1-like 1 [Saguinus oedipus]
MSFVLEFRFEPNEYFTNEVLTKTYRMRSEPDDSDPFSFDGPEIMGCTVPKSGDLDDAAEAILAADFEIGHFSCEPILPRSVLYFTGEAIEDDDDDYDEESEEADEEGEEEGDEENDPDYDPKKDQNPAECKQQ